MSNRRAVITGIGIVSPLGSNVNTFWENIKAGKSGIRNLTKFDPKNIYCHIVGEVSGFDTSFIPDKERKRMDDFSLFALGAAVEAVNNSGIDLNKINPYRRGVIIGNGSGGVRTLESLFRELPAEDGSFNRLSPFSVPKYIGNIAASNIAIRYGMNGVNFGVNSACASSGHAIGLALDYIRNGKADMFIVGGTEAAITPTGLQSFCSARALSSRNDNPSAASRPFDRDRDGFVMSEGSAILVVEEEKMARARNANIYAEISGSAFTCDAYHITQPSGDGAVNTMKLALEDAMLDSRDIQYIHAHGTSTEVGDVIETESIKRVFNGLSDKLMVSATKSMTGHMIGAAGAMGAAVCALSIRDKVIAPTTNYENPDPRCDLDYVPNQTREIQIYRCLSNSFGFGGQNASLVLERYD